MQTWCILLAAGQGTRLEAQPQKKQFLKWRDRPLYWHSTRIFLRMPCVQGIVFVFPADELQHRTLELQELFRGEQLGMPFRAVTGGLTRQDSSWAGIQALPWDCSHVLIHDAARPFISPPLVQGVVQALENGAQAVAPGLRPADTIKLLQAGQSKTLTRDCLFAVQTPQGFDRKVLEQAYSQAIGSGKEFTDDAAVLEEYGHKIDFVSGRLENSKITRPEDLKLLKDDQEAILQRICVGYGHDVHRYGPGRPLRLGGVPVTNGPQVIAHSDGDVLLHAIMDAFLGCLGQGDIGQHFPDSDPDLENANSALLLSEVLHLAEKQGLKILHLDLTIICEIPKIYPWRDQIRKNLCNLLYLEQEQLGLKASTEEGLGLTGEKKGIKAVALLTALKCCGTSTQFSSVRESPF